MSPDEIVSGRSRAWSLLEKLGEGDAGEVFLVQSLMEEGRAILKRPHRGAFSSEKLRQAAQIEREGQALRALAYLGELPSCVRTPQFLDQSKANVEESDRFFIIITPATGFDLRTLARCRRLRGAPNRTRHTARRISERFSPSFFAARCLPQAAIIAPVGRPDPFP